MRLEIELKSMYSNGVPNRNYENVKKWRMTSYNGVSMTFDDGRKEVITDVLRVKERW